MVSSNCEKCNQPHDGSYGSGRFCCSRCAHAFCTEEKRHLINKKISVALMGRISPSRGKRNVSWLSKNCKCGTTFEVPPCKSAQKFCSRECARQLCDHSGGALRAFQRGSRKITGGTTRWIQYNDIKVQGTYELRTCRILDAMKASMLIKDWHYAHDRINYVWDDGIEHTYLIDFTLENSDGSLLFLEVKGFKREHDERKWEAAKNLGMNHQVWFLADIIEHERALNL